MHSVNTIRASLNSGDSRAGQGLCIAGYGDCRYLHDRRDICPSSFELADSSLGEFAVLRFELATPLYDRIRQGWRGVQRFEGPNDQVRLQREILARSEWYEFERGLLLFEVDPTLEHSLERTRKVGMTDDAARAQLLEMALAQPIGKATEMVHVCMGEGNRRRTERRSRALAHIEDHVEFRNLNDGLLTCDAYALNAIWG